MNFIPSHLPAGRQGNPRVFEAGKEKWRGVISVSGRKPRIARVGFTYLYEVDKEALCLKIF
jgi:hypothetical protein